MGYVVEIVTNGSVVKSFTFTEEQKQEAFKAYQEKDFMLKASLVSFVRLRRIHYYG